MIFSPEYFAGLLVYEEHLAQIGDKPFDRATRSEVANELAGAQRLMLELLPPTLFFQLLAGIEDCCDLERSAPLVEEFLLNLDRSDSSIYLQDALQFVPTVVFRERSVGVTNLARRAGCIVSTRMGYSASTTFEKDYNPATNSSCSTAPDRKCFFL